MFSFLLRSVAPVVGTVRGKAKGPVQRASPPPPPPCQPNFLLNPASQRQARNRKWDLVAPGGKALAFNLHRLLFVLEAGGVTATYDMYVENSKAHIMKRSGMDVDVISAQQTLPLYSVSTHT